MCVEGGSISCWGGRIFLPAPAVSSIVDSILLPNYNPAQPGSACSWAWDSHLTGILGSSQSLSVERGRLAPKVWVKAGGGRSDRLPPFPFPRVSCWRSSSCPPGAECEIGQAPCLPAISKGQVAAEEAGGSSGQAEAGRKGGSGGPARAGERKGPGAKKTPPSSPAVPVALSIRTHAFQLEFPPKFTALSKRLGHTEGEMEKPGSLKQTLQ